MRGISTVFEIFLILLIMISLVIVLWLFTSGTVKGLTEAGTERTTRTREILSTCMIVDSVHDNKIYIKNCGDGVIVNDSLNVFIDDEPLEFNMTPETIKKGEIGTITTNLLGVSIGDYDLKISNPSLQIVQRVESVLPDSCVLAFDFDKDYEEIIHDKSGHVNDGILNILNGDFYGNVYWVKGKFEHGLKFDGSGDYVRIDSLPQLGPNPPSGNNGPVTITLWFKTSDITPSETKYLFSDNHQEIGFGLLTSGYLYAEVYQSVISLKPITDDWHFAALSYDYDNRIMSFYLYNSTGDGGLQGSTSVTIGNGFNDAYFGIGADWASGNVRGFFNGIIDELRIWNKSLSEEEIQAEMQSSRPISQPVVWSFGDAIDILVKGIFGKALEFDGINDFIRIHDDESFDITDELTIMAWIYPSSDQSTGGSNQIIQRLDWSGNRGFFLREGNVQNHEPQFWVANGTDWTSVSAGSTSPDRWYHIAGTVKANDKIRIYINGQLQEEGDFKGNIVQYTGIIRIGRERAGLTFKGIIDSLRIYNKFLSPDEINKINLKMK